MPLGGNAGDTCSHAPGVLGHMGSNSTWTQAAYPQSSFAQAGFYRFFQATPHVGQVRVRC